MKPVIGIARSVFTDGVIETVKGRAPNYEVRTFSGRSPAPKDVADCEIIFGLLADPQILKHAKSLKWMSSVTAGVDALCDEGLYHSPDVILTNSSGAYGVAIAEYMMTCALQLFRRTREYDERQREHDWSGIGALRSLHGCTAAVVGFGDIGEEFAKRLRAFGATVIGVRKSGRSNEFADEMRTLSNLADVVGRADIIASSLPGTPETEKLFSADLFSHFKKGSIFINVGRGTGCDLNALLEALEAGTLSGAALDVTDPEPLPADSPLWDRRDVIITPHISGGNSVDYTVRRIGELFLENLTRYLAGEPLLRVANRKKGY